jgi:YD repeat-containing protein
LGSVTSRTYNDLGLVTQEAWVDGFGNTVKTIVHGYDDAGREISISDGVTAYQYQYDLAGRLTQVDNAQSVLPQVTLNNYYDFEGNRVWLSDSLGGQVWYSWNNQRLQSMAMTTEADKYAGVDFTYDQVGRLNYISRTANWDPATTINTGLMLYVMKSLHHF